PAALPDPPSFPTRRSSDLDRDRLPSSREPNGPSRSEVTIERPQEPGSGSARIPPERNLYEPGRVDHDRLAVDTASRKDIARPFADRKSTRLNSSHVSISYA